MNIRQLQLLTQKKRILATEFRKLWISSTSWRVDL